MNFLQALADPNFGFLRLALAVGLLASLAFGVVGSFVVARRTTALAGAISHAVLAGIGLSLYLARGHGWSWLDPLHGATLTAVLAALLLGWVRLRGGEREDSVISAVWSIGMALGLIFLSLTPGYVDPMGYLFGNILVLAPRDLWLVAGLDVLTLGLALGFYPQLRAICFDEEFARLRGLPVGALYLLLQVLTALTVVLLLSVVGAVLVVALLALPAATAGRFTRSLWQMMALASGLCALAVCGGLALSYHWDLPAGPCIVLLAGAAYLLSALRKA